MGSIKMFFGVFVIVATVYISAKLIPPYFENYQFQDAIKNQATLDTYTTKNENEIRQSVFRKAQDLEIPIAEESIHVQRQGMQGSGLIIIRAPYVVHVELPGYPLDLHFEASTENKGVL
jgi:23S rRNA A2030 N6-methylase RlmJ